jgi:hypothetical protein
MQHPIHFHGQRFVVVTRDGRFEENLVWKDTVLVKAGEMISVAADARSLPNPVGVDIKRVIRTSRLVQEGDLDSMGLIMETVEDRMKAAAKKAPGKATKTPLKPFPFGEKK